MPQAEAPDAVAATLARFTHRLALAQVPDHVARRARHLMLDALGCALAACGEGFAVHALEAVEALAGDDAPGGCAVIGHDRRLPARDAALMNGVLAHGLDYDDTHMAGVIHLSASVLPAVLALGARRGASGAALLEAYVAGVESGARVASAVQGGLHLQGFHPTGVAGAFACALAAGKLLALDERQLAQAQGIALSLASGSLQFIEDGSWTKRLHPGWAAQAGIAAATFARAFGASELDAPRSPYLGRYGFYRAWLGPELHERVDPALATAGLAEDGRVTQWETSNVAVKPFPVCHFNHAACDAAIALRAQGVRAQDVEAIEARVPAGVVAAVCEPPAAKRRPRSDYDARFSLPYAVACGLLHGRLGLHELRPEAFEDPAALALMQRVRCTPDPASTYPRHYTGELRATLADGRVIVHRESVNRGHAERPLADEEIRAKFFANAGLRFPRAHAQAVCEHVVGRDGLADARALDALLARSPQASAP